MATPETGDVLLALQLLASIRARAWIGDVKSAFTQSLKNNHPTRLVASPPSDGLPDEDDQDILIELVAEVYGLITGRPAWRSTLITAFKELDFKRHPLAPCLALCYEDHGGGKEVLIRSHCY